jgi:hypothetical protein
MRTLFRQCDTLNGDFQQVTCNFDMLKKSDIKTLGQSEP